MKLILKSKLHVYEIIPPIPILNAYVGSYLSEIHFSISTNEKDLILTFEHPINKTKILANIVIEGDSGLKSSTFELLRLKVG